MNIRKSKNGEFIVLEVHGRVDTLTAGDFETEVMAAMADGTSLVIDCSGIDYISSSGLRVFLLAFKKIQLSEGKLRLCCLQPNIREIFDISGFSSVFTLCNNQEEALTI